MNKIILNADRVFQQFGDNRVLHDVNLQIVQGQFTALVGPSGCGKSTLFRSVLGTDPPSSGLIEVDGREITSPNRDVGIVYQKYGLYSFLTAIENVAFGLLLSQTSILFRIFVPWLWWPLRRRHHLEARHLLHRFKLWHASESYPSELSGGMQQRVAIAQALIMRPKLLLLDEPFGALDEATREELQKMLLELYQENLRAKKRGKVPPWTVILVTHELNEAFYCSDRVVALSKKWYEDTPAGRITGQEMGSTKVWDKCTPVFYPDAPRDFEIFHAAKQELRKVAFDENMPAVERNEHVSYWEDLEKGVGTGVVMENGK